MKAKIALCIILLTGCSAVEEVEGPKVCKKLAEGLVRVDTVKDPSIIYEMREVCVHWESL
jgi:hypothetical protein